MDAVTSYGQLIVVTGASGFIATHVIKQLQESGHRVRGTVRSLKNEDKIRHFTSLCPEAQFKLELVEADLLDSESWERAVKDASYVIHVASPVPTVAPKHEDDVIKPAVEGTLNVLKACVAGKSVRRVVMTSSVGAVTSIGAGEGKIFTEEDWNSLHRADAYSKSKTMAEKAAWKFIEELPDENKLELAVINPAYSTGPVLGSTFSAGMELPKRLLEHSMPFIIRMNFPIIDVRDVAEIHIKALFTPDAAGHRHIATTSNMWFADIARTYTEEFKQQGYSVPSRTCPEFLIWISSFFDKTLKMIYPLLGVENRFDNTRMKEVFKIEPRDVKQALLDMAYSMIEGGFIKKTSEYRGPPSGTDGGRTVVEQKQEEKT